jgi:hypothetical protein
MDRVRESRNVMSRRASRLIAALSVTLIVAVLVPGGARGAVDDEFVTGSGTSYAQFVRVGPTAGQLSLAPVFGLSLADYVNTVGRGQATVADWAGIGVAERSLPDNTPIVKARSTEKDADKGKTVVVGGGSDGETGGGIAELYARATKAPLGEGRFRLTSMTIPGLIEARSSVSHAQAGVKGQTREAVAMTEIGVLSIGGGAVELKGLRWVSTQQTGGKKSVKGTFTIEGATIGGAPLEMPAGPSELEAIAEPINTALAPIGLSISMPVVENRAGQASVSPLSVDIENSPAGRQFIAPILDALRPVREPIADAFIDLAKSLVEANEDIPDASVAILLADLSLGILSGSSQLHLEFGGVTAFTEGQTFESPFGRGIDFSPPKVAPPQTVFEPGRVGTPGTPGTSPSDEGTLVAAPVPGTRTVPGDRGGVAVAVGLIGLAVAIALATADWWRMHRSKQALTVGA